MHERSWARLMRLWDLTDVQLILQQAVLDETRWADALGWISACVEGAGAVLIASDRRVAKPQASPNIAEMAEAYGSGGWHVKDMRYLGLPAMKARGIMTDHDFIRRDEMRRSEYYQDFLNRHDREYFAGVGFQAEDDLWVLSIQRTIAQGAF